MELINLIPVGKKNSITRDELVGATGMSDREVRREIGRLRNKGTPICATIHGNGYFLAESEEEFKQAIREYTAYARSIFKTAAQMKKGFYNRDQISMEEKRPC